MFLRKFLDIILIFTLALQLFPTTQSGRFFVFETDDEECMDITETSKNALRQLDEEQHKDLHIENGGLNPPFWNMPSKLFHYSEMIPPPHHGSIPTPPPNVFA